MTWDMHLVKLLCYPTEVEVAEEEVGGGEKKEAERVRHPSAKCKTNQALQRDVSDFRCEFHVAEM